MVILNLRNADDSDAVGINKRSGQVSRFRTRRLEAASHHAINRQLLPEGRESLIRSPELSGCSPPAYPAYQYLLVTVQCSAEDITMHLGTVCLGQLALIFALCGAAAPGASLPAKAESGGKRPIAFSGRVESVDLKLQTVAIKHGPIPGFMPAMTMDYPIDNKALLKQLKPDDEITATVYVGDPTLHDVSVVNSSSGDKHR